MPAEPSTRTTWKGAISFGLVHIPITLTSAIKDTREKFRMFDSEGAAPIGYQHVNKLTGQAVAQENIVKGVEVEEGSFVTLTKDEIRAALPKTTQTIEIEAFVDAGEIPPTFFNKPYHVAPVGRGAKPFVLLRDTLKKTGKVGVARVVISTRQHLAALIPTDKGMVLNLLRWDAEVRAPAESALPDVSVTDKEIKMAEMLVNDLATAWSPDLFHDEFKEQVAALVQAKAARGEVAVMQAAPGQEVAQPSAEVIDLTELLKRSLQSRVTPVKTGKVGKGGAANDEPAPARRAAASKTPAKAKASVKPKRRAA